VKLQAERGFGEDGFVWDGRMLLDAPEVLFFVMCLMRLTYGH